MTRPIQDWRDAYEAVRNAASIAEDTRNIAAHMCRLEPYEPESEA